MDAKAQRWSHDAAVGAMREAMPYVLYVLQVWVVELNRALAVFTHAAMAASFCTDAHAWHAHIGDNATNLFLSHTPYRQEDKEVTDNRREDVVAMDNVVEEKICKEDMEEENTQKTHGKNNEVPVVSATTAYTPPHLPKRIRRNVRRRHDVHKKRKRFISPSASFAYSSPHLRFALSMDDPHSPMLLSRKLDELFGGVPPALEVPPTEAVPAVDEWLIQMAVHFHGVGGGAVAPMR